VNTVTASGEANGLTAKDFAIATVVVTPVVVTPIVLPTANVVVPKLPNTGLSPDENTISWNIIIPAGIFTILILLYFTQRKQTV
jgi:hypothetical protein